MTRDVTRPEAGAAAGSIIMPDREQRAERLEAADEVEHDRPRKMKCTGPPAG